MEEDEHDEVPMVLMSALEESLRSITQTALACPTLTGRRRHHAAAMVLEREHARSAHLARQLVDVKVGMKLFRNDSRDEEESLFNNGPIEQQQKQKLWEIAIQRQQEGRLLERIRMAKTANRLVFPHGGDEGGRVLLRKEVMASRSQQLSRALALTEELDDLRATLKILSRREHQLRQTQIALPTESPDRSNDDELSQENRILARLMQDLVVKSGLDWYQDERLRRLILRLEDCT